MAAIGVPAVLGPVLGPILGGTIVADLSWHWIFYVNLPICVLALVLSARVVPRHHGQAAAPGSRPPAWRCCCR